ncbi:MAG: LacI family DNA-binding transcriptional regulator [Brotaphodocola sp.]
MKKATIKDLALMAGVSPSCVSMILNGQNLARFSEETIQKVHQARRETGYIPKKDQRHKNPKETILIICPSVMNPYYATLIQGMEQEARLRNFVTMIYTTYWDSNEERNIMESAVESDFAGIIFSMIPQQPELAEEISRRIPMVAVGDRNVNLKIDTVDVNNYRAGQMIGRHLIQLGHKHVAYISTTLNAEHTSRTNRCDGLKAEFAKLCPEGTVEIYTQNVSTEIELYTTSIEFEVGYALANKCLAESPRITAMVVMNDMIAYGVRQALLDAGKRIPEDISLCGFDNIYPSRFHDIDLTTIEHAIVERGKGSVRLLSAKLKKQSDLLDSNAITRMEYESNLIIGTSTGPARKQEP